MKICDWEMNVLNFERIDLSDLDNKPSTFLDNDIWCNEVLSDDIDKSIDEETEKKFILIMEKRRNEFKL